MNAFNAWPEAQRANSACAKRTALSSPRRMRSTASAADSSCRASDLADACGPPANAGELARIADVLARNSRLESTVRSFISPPARVKDAHLVDRGRRFLGPSPRDAGFRYLSLSHSAGELFARKVICA